MRLRKDDLQSLFWFLALFGFMFQWYNTALAKLIVPCLVLFLITEVCNMELFLVNGWMILFCIYVIYLVFCVGHSLFTGAAMSSIMRFLFILLAIPLAETIRDSRFESKWKIFKLLCFLNAVIIIVFWLVVFSEQDYTDYRMWAQETGVGDVYIINKIPRIQLRGTSLFVIGFGIDLFREKKITVFSSLSLLGGLAAGNSAYVLGYAFFIFAFVFPKLIEWIKRKNWKLLILVPLLVAGILFFFIYSIRVMDTKAAFANAVRFSQAEILLDTNIVLGDGLGHAVSGIGFGRVYNGNIYFELQTLYIFNQIGATGIFLFYALTFLLCMDSRQKMKAYLIYLVYTFWNPYCFDSTHIIALLIISNALNSFAGNGKKVLHMEKRKQRKSILKLGDIKT